MRLDGKAAIVPGTAQGIGKVSIIRLAQEGADIVALDLDLERSGPPLTELKVLGR